MAAAEIHVGRLDLPAGEVERLARSLSPEEVARAERFVFARDRRRFVVRRARLRGVLAMATGVAPDRIAYTRNRHGKPAIARGPRFSASHSHDLWAVALAERELGLDIEHRQPELDWRDLAAGLFRDDEYAALKALAPEDAVRGFFDCWARKEAFVKALGLGLSYPLDAFAVSVSGEARLLAGGAGWAIRTIPLAPDYAAALVIADDGAPITIVTHRHHAGGALVSPAAAA